MTLRLRPYLVVLFFAALSFGATLRLGFIWDDHEMIENNPAITALSIENIKAAFSTDVFNGKGDPYYRPAQTVANMIDYQLWGLKPAGYHVTNFFFHALATALLLFLLRSFFPARMAFIAAAFFAVHPIVVEQLIIIAGRAELMSLAFTLAAIVCCLRRDARGYGLAAVFYLLACLSKESGVVFPLFLALLAWNDEKIKPPLWAYALFAGVLAVYAVLRMNAVTAPLLPPLKEIALTVARDLPSIIVSYVRVILFPVDLHSHRRMLFPTYYMVMSPVLVLLPLVYIAFKKFRVGLLAAGWFGIGFLPKLPNFASSALMLDHWGYVSAIGVFVLLAHGLVVLSEKTAGVRAAVGAGFSILLTFWIACSWYSIMNRRTDFHLLHHAMRYPTSSVVRGNLALLYYDNGYLKEAERYANEALAINPQNAQAQKIKDLISSRPQNSRPSR